MQTTFGILIATALLSYPCLSAMLSMSEYNKKISA